MRGEDTALHPGRQVSRDRGSDDPNQPWWLPSSSPPANSDPNQAVISSEVPLAGIPGPTKFYAPRPEEPDMDPNYIFMNWPWGLATQGPDDALDNVMNHLLPPVEQA